MCEACFAYGGWGEERCTQSSGGETEGQETTWNRQKDNIKFDLQDMGYGGDHGLERSGPGQGQVAGTCYCGNEPSGSTRNGEFLH